MGYRGLLPDRLLDGLRVEDRVARYTCGYRGEATPRTIVTDDARIRGFATVGPARDPGPRGDGEPYAIYVDPSSWSTGIGRALLAEAIALLREGGYRQAVLWMPAGNERADHFYQRAGWAPDGATKRSVFGGTPFEVACLPDRAGLKQRSTARPSVARPGAVRARPPRMVPEFSRVKG